MERHERDPRHLTRTPRPLPSAAGAVLELLQRGAAGRHTAATKLNDASSRSHLLLTCAVEGRTVEEGAGVTTRSSRLHLVDLAGSERSSKAEVRGGAAAAPVCAATCSSRARMRGS